MNFLNMKYFLVLAEELNFTKSAQRLHISQQSLSSHITRLEKECGLQLIDRDPPIHLTQAGEAFLQSANLILDEKDALEKRMADLLDRQNGTIKLGIPSSRSVILMPPVLARFHREFPDVKVRLIEGNSSDILKFLLKGTVDLLLGFQTEPSERLESQPVYMESTKILVPNAILEAMPNGKELLSHRQALPLRTFADCPFIALYEGTATGRVLLDIAAEEKFTPRIVAETKNLLTMLSLCASGLGVCICPNSYLIVPDSLVDPSLMRKMTVFDMSSDLGDSWIAFTWAKNHYRSIPERYLMKIVQEMYPQTTGNG